MKSVSDVVNLVGGIATRQQLIAAGFSGSDLTREVRIGTIRRVRQARYTTGACSPDAIAAVRVGGMLAGPSAARSFGLWAGFDTRLHVSVGEGSSRLRTNHPPSFSSAYDLTPDTSPRPVVVHWLVGGATPELGPECWRVPLATCLRQMVEWCDRETALACLDTALTMMSAARLSAVFAGAPAAHRLMVAECRTGSDSGLESIVRQRFASIGIVLEQQVQIPGVGRVDARVVGTRVLIEVDSREYHGSLEAFERDRWRTAELVARGYIVVRLSYHRIVNDWPWCVRMVLAATRSIIQEGV